MASWLLYDCHYSYSTGKYHNAVFIQPFTVRPPHSPQYTSLLFNSHSQAKKSFVFRSSLVFITSQASVRFVCVRLEWMKESNRKKRRRRRKKTCDFFSTSSSHHPPIPNDVSEHGEKIVLSPKTRESRRNLTISKTNKTKREQENLRKKLCV